MKYTNLVTLFFSLLLGWNTSAQSQRKIDSIKLLLTYKLTDSLKITHYKNLSWEYAVTRAKTDSAKMYADSLLQLGNKLNSEEVTVFAHFYYGVIGRFEANYNEALNHLEKFVSYNKKIGNSHREVSGLFQVGVIHNNLGNFEESLKCYQRVLAIHKQNEYMYGVGFTLNGIGLIHKQMNNYDKAIKYFNEALKLSDSLHFKESSAIVLNNLGNIYSEKEDFYESLGYHLKALKINEETKHMDGISNSYQNIGTTYSKIGNYDQALEYQLKALELLKNSPERRTISNTLRNLGNTYLKKKNYKNSKKYLNQSLTIAEDINAKPIIRDVYKSLEELYESQRDFKNAYHYQGLFLIMNDSIINEETANQINELQIKYDASQKDQEIALLTKESELQQKEMSRQAAIKNVVIGSAVFIILLASLLFYIFKQRVKNQRLIALKNSEIKDVNFKQQLSDLEMKALRAQMNPHFLFNCLNSINRMILSGDTKEASRYLTKFSRLIRKVLENSEKNMVSLSDELTMLKSYIQLEALRFRGKISYKTNIDTNINLDDMYIPSMVLQPLIENAIWHGLMHKETGGTIMLTIVKEDNVLKCSVEDDGVGRSINQILKKDSDFVKQKSMGLHLTNKRLQIMSELGSERFIEIIDLKSVDNQSIGTRVDLLIPIAS